MTLAMRPPTHGFRLWYSVLAGIGWWMVHIITLASLVHVSCRHGGVVWVMHAVTVALTVATALAVVWSMLLVRAAADADDEAGDAAGRKRSLGVGGVLIGATSMLLIVWEGSYVAVVSSCA